MLLRIQGKSLTGVSLPGLRVGLRTHVQAGESVPRCPSSLLLMRTRGHPQAMGMGNSGSGLKEGESGRFGAESWGPGGEDAL